MVHLTQFFEQLAEQTERCYHQYLNTHMTMGDAEDGPPQ